MTKYQLFALLAQKGCVEVCVNGIRGIVFGVEREDGSGSSFIIHLHTKGGKTERVYLRTID